MTEEKTKKRGWVKNAAIIFLAVLLVLTFFSSTIMNRSLPEVAIQTAKSGTIDSQVRGTGTVKAVETFEVKAPARRTVLSVDVTLGQYVSPGDLLMTFSQASETRDNTQLQQELDAAIQALKELEKAYERSQINAKEYDYTRQEREIEKQREAVAEAIAARDALFVTDETYNAALQAVENAKQALKDAEQAVKDAEKKVEDLEAEKADADKRVQEAQEKVDSVSQNDPDYSEVKSAERQREQAQQALNQAYAALSEANSAVSAAQKSKDAIVLQYQTAYNELMNEVYLAIEKDYKDEIKKIEEQYNKDHPAPVPVESSGDGTGEGESAGETEPEPVKTEWEKLSLEQQRTHYQNILNSHKDVYLLMVVATLRGSEPKDSKVAAYDAYQAADEAIKTAQSAASAASRERDSAQSSYNDADAAVSAALIRYNQLNHENYMRQTYLAQLKNVTEERDGIVKQIEDAGKAVNEAGKTVTTAEKGVEDANKSVSELDSKKEQYKSAGDAVESAEESLDNLLFELEQQKKSDNKQKELDSLDRRDAREAIEEQKKTVAELKEKLANEPAAAESEVFSQVYGVVKQVAVTSGNTVNEGDAMLVIEVPDRGYELQFSVPLEQARKVNVGDEAEMGGDYWWGSMDMHAELAAIKTDPKSPQQNRLLVFSLSGADVQSGESMTLAIGARSTSYETIVPKSAVREDSNGKFIFVVTAKQSPIGNRYQAKRVDVEVLESDGLNAAISGAVAMGDYVITNATAPVEDGMYVRLTED